MRLDDLQTMMIAAIDHGPDQVVDAAFLGGRAGALRGLRVHANTISHARLVALEDSFPRSRTRIGEADFNALSRAYLELPAIGSEPHAAIGRRFAQFLRRSGHGEEAALAGFEWAWLEAYHAADAEAAPLAGFSGMAEDQLLQSIVARHPAARLVASFRDAALEDEVPGLAGAAAILVTRPGAEVRVSPASAAMARLFDMLAEPQTICNLLECGGEPAGEDSLQALFAMLDAAALVLA